MYEEFDEFDLKQKIDYKLWGKIARTLKPYWRDWLGALIAIAIVALCETMFMYQFSKGIGDFIEQETLDGLVPFIAFTSVFVVLQGTFVFLFIYFAGRLEIKFYSHLTKNAFEHLQKLSFSFFDKNSVGWLMARVTSDTNRLSEIISWGMVDVIWAIAKLAFILVIMYMYDPQLTAIVLIIVPIVILVSMAFRTIVIQESRKVRRLNSKITGSLNEGISGAKTSKSLVLEDKNIAEFKELTGKFRKASIKSACINSIYYQIISVSAGVGIAVTAYWGGMKVLGGFLSVEILYLFFDFMRSFFDPILNVARISNDMKHAQVAAERVFNLISHEPEIKDKEEVIAKYGDELNLKKENWEELKGEVEFDHVSFRYSTGPVILDDFNLHVKAGQSVAIVGETGAGKSTIVNLICRFYEPTSGVIKIDGVDYKERSVAWLHANQGYVLQSPQLFSGTIKENIGYGNLSATDEDIINAAKAVDADRFIMQLEKGYDTEVGEGGNRLSVGQKQLISFARAIVANPKILILDEATSSVDTETEYIIQQATSKLLKGRTSFLIAHRLSTITGADLILVLKHGKIIEQGTHEELLNLKGAYYRLYTNQFIEEQTQQLIN
jgi:ATP-binding cassette subfamily B protein